MSDWRTLRLDEVADRVATKNTAGYTRVMTVSAGRGLVDQEEYFTKRVASNDLSGYLTLEPGDFVYNKSSSKDAPWGVIARNDSGTPALVTSLYIAFRPRTDVVNPDFFLLACNSSTFFDSLRGRLREGARAHGLLNVRLQEFFAADVPIPPLAEQHRIIDLVASVDALVEVLDRECTLALSALAALRRELLQPRSHWETAPISELAITATGRAFPNRYQGAPSGVLPYFKVSDMVFEGNEREMRFAPNWVTEESMPAVKPRVCPAGTVIFPIIGAAMLTEKRRVLTRDAAFDQNVMGLILGDRVTSDFMFAVMSSIRLGDISQSGAVPMVNQKLVGAIPVAVPPLDEQKAIGATLRQSHLHVESLQDELHRLRSMRSTLVAALLVDEVRIPAAYDLFLAEVA